METKIKLVEGTEAKEITIEEYNKLVESGVKLMLLQKESQEQGIKVYKKVKALKG